MVDKKNFKPKYNVVAAIIYFNRALECNDYKEAKRIAEMCIRAQEEE